MRLGKGDLLSLAELASEAVAKAGALIAASEPRVVERKSAGHSAASQVVTDVDRQAERLILALLAPSVEQFDLGVLSEEQPDTGLRRDKHYFWCVDPLDGTLPFTEACPGYAVSIALVAHDGTPVIGAVFDPVKTVQYLAVRGQGVLRNRRPWTSVTPGNSDTLSVLFDRSFRDSDDFDRVDRAVRAVAHDMGLSGVEILIGAGAVMNACAVLEGPPACYFKFPKAQPGGGSVWDFAATACLFTEAGAIATDIHGERLDLNRADSTFMNHRGVVFATDAGLAERIRALYVA